MFNLLICPQRININAIAPFTLTGKVYCFPLCWHQSYYNILIQQDQLREKKHAGLNSARKWIIASKSMELDGLIN